MFVKIPFLPSGKITCVIVDCNAPTGLIDYLKKQNITVILSTKVNGIMSSTATHPDMQIHPLGGNLLLCEPTVFAHYQTQLSPLGFEIIKGNTVLQNHYPKDIAYNVSRLNRMVFHRLKYTDSGILAHLKHAAIGISDLKQGYTKCAMCIVAENAVITEDAGIAKTLSKHGIDALLVEEGAVKLHGFPKGFLGGCCGLISPDKLLFCGDITKHNNFNKMTEFAHRHKVDIIPLTTEFLTDIGSIIPIMQV